MMKNQITFFGVIMKNVILSLFIILQVLFTGTSYSEETEGQIIEKEQPSYFLENFGSEPQQDENHFLKELLNMLFTLGGIIFLLFGVTWVMKRMQSGRIKYNNNSSLIKIADHRALSTKTGIYLIHVHGQAILIADSHNGATHLATFPIENQEFEIENDDKVKKKFDTY